MIGDWIIYIFITWIDDWNLSMEKWQLHNNSSAPPQKEQWTIFLFHILRVISAEKKSYKQKMGIVTQKRDNSNAMPIISKMYFDIGDMLTSGVNVCLLIRQHKKFTTNYVPWCWYKIYTGECKLNFWRTSRVWW